MPSALLSRPAGDRDVADAIAQAGREGRPPALDLSRLRGIAVDARERTVRLGGGVTQGRLDLAVQADRLAATGPCVPDVSVAAALLAGAGGWLQRASGSLADHLAGARVVTADGSVVETSADAEPDLFWALRHGGRLGVITELRLRLRPLGPEVVGGVRAYELDRAEEVLAAYGEAVAAAPRELAGGVVIGTTPPAPTLPASLHGRPLVGVVVLWAGPREEAQAGLRPLRALGKPVADLVRPVPYLALQRLFEPGIPGLRPELRECSHTGRLDGLGPVAAADLAQLASELTPQSAIVLRPLGGDLEGRWDYELRTAWPDPAEDTRGVAWTRAAAAVLADHGPRDPRDPQTVARLDALRRAWDPAGVLATSAPSAVRRRAAASRR